MKFILPLLLFFLFLKTGLSQTEYKISTEGFTFEKPVGNTVILKIYLSVANIGALEEFPGEVKKIKLKSSNYNFDKDIFFVDYKKIIGNGENLTNFSVYALSFLIPMDAANIKIVFPERYGGLTVDVTKKNYYEWSESNSPEFTSSKGKSKTILPSFTNTIGISFSFDIGILNNSTIGSNSIPIGSIGLELMPRLYSFGKDKKSAIYATGNIRWGGWLSKGNASGLSSFYNPDTSRYKIKDKELSDSASINYFSYGAGLGAFIHLGAVNPMLSISYVNTTFLPHKMLIKNVSPSTSYYDVSKYDGWGIQVDAGIQLIDGLLIAYSFRQFTIDSGYTFLNKQHNMHTLKIAVWGWGD